MKNTTFKIKGMHCPSCEMLIKDSLETEEGVEKVEVSNEKGYAKVSFNEDKTSKSKLKFLIEEEGYEVTK